MMSIKQRAVRYVVKQGVAIAKQRNKGAGRAKRRHPGGFSVNGKPTMTTPPRIFESQWGFQALMASILILLVLVAEPQFFLPHLPHSGHLTADLLHDVRLWLVCVAVCFALNRLMEMVLQRRMRNAWVYIMAWSAIIPFSYGLVVREVDRHWPGYVENSAILLTVIVLVGSFGVIMMKRLADSVMRTAQYDHLTNLPNRVLLNQSLADGIERAQRTEHKMGVVMFNIDRFKRINTSLGRAGGDAVLAHVARQLRATALPGHTVARIGGDEFVVVMTDLDSMEEAQGHVQRLTDALATPTMVGNREVCVTASFGICLYPDGADDAAGPLHKADAAAGTLHKADAAMFEAKNSGRINQSGTLARRGSSDRLEMEEDFRRALQNGELSLHYQPQISLATREVTGLEALLRWNSPRRGNVAPAEFIAMAEEVGLLIPVGEWALRQACRDCVELQKLTNRPLTMALNLSARQFASRGLATLVENTLADTGLSPLHLELEITEQMLMVNSAHTLATLQAIRDMGVGLAIDDFGTGFSSFAYILQYHVDRIKIDQSFIARSITDPSATAVVRTIIAMAHGLNMRVVAEGVETQQQSDFLMRRRCDDAQGYLFAKPVPKREVAAAIERIRLEFGQAKPVPDMSMLLPHIHQAMPENRLHN